MVDVQATFYAQTYGSVPIGKTTAGVNGARMRTIHDKYNPGVVDQDKDILFGKLSEGAIIHDWLVTTGGLLAVGTTLQLFLRDQQGNQTAFSSVFPVVDESAIRPTEDDRDLLPFFVDNESILVAQIGGPNPPNGLLKFMIYYSIV